MRSPIRWRKAEGELQYRCESCAIGGHHAWWPLTEDFWDFARSFTRCRACWRAYDKARIAVIRQDPGYRAKEREYAKAYWDAQSMAERRAIYAKKRAYHREWMRAYRARKAA